ncbi:hypothetical protein SPRG_05963 [Saprolegnia parasitica CBS 223.65]|uniref:C2H2-type domain-containing protein n=1 Tax=Saprolegnia parasitica (strain CBS 223.65) TaxID=695850 RepID=A0A067CJP8_SAPPC|nr:hypothetical protein SPRG_05963 [Saprolegnia parasitica CBS 223.65]KDO29425.1 hypothetical protein SPRG_05963 [Saprolegnia parasitica CBS 223.65]|eukprot:XP_012199926.1 hypothetical protein SPRG_05963 [Saprolegnia parasitica CBS 223.65]
MALTLPQFHTSAYSHPLLTVHVPPSMDRRERRFQCEEPGCGKRFNRKFTLKEHMKTHTGARPYICDYEGCTSSFSTSGNLSRHKFTHTGEKPYGCTIAMCTKRFCTKEKLARHMKTHSGIRPFSCKVDGCHKKFSTSGNLGRHMKTHRSHVASSPSTQGSSGSEHHGQHELDHDIISALSSPGKQAAQQAKWKADKPRFPTIMRSQSDFSVRSFNTPNNMHIAVPQSSSSSAGRLQFNLFDSPLSTSNGSSSYSWPPAQFPSSTYHHHHGGSYGSGLTITSQYQNSSNGGFKIEHDLLRDAIPQYEPLPFDRTGVPKISRSQSDGAVLGHSDLMNDFYYDH